MPWNAQQCVRVRSIGVRGKKCGAVHSSASVVPVGARTKYEARQRVNAVN